MIKLTPVFASLAFIAAAPVTARAADLYEGGYAVEGVVVDDEAPVVVERERIIERRYYPSGAYVAVEPDPEVEVYARYRPDPYPDRGYRDAGDEW
jgi:hypothetical protein